MGIPVGSQFWLYLICSFVSLGGFMYGFDSGVISSILVMPSFQQYFRIDPDSPIGYTIVPISLAASFLASFASGFVADALGRKRFFFVASIIHVLGCIVELAGQTKASLIAGRIITGFSIGIYSMLVPLYQSEIAKPNNRGRLITLYQIFVTLGFCIAFWMAYGSFRLERDVSWRAPLGLQMVAGIIMLFGLFFIPESPRWLIYKDRNAEALTILANLRAKGDEHDVDVQMEFTGIVQDVSFDKMAYTKKFTSLLRKGNDNNRKRTLLGMGVHIFTQLSGINAILFYLPHILETSGIKEVYSALLGNGVGGAVNFIATLFVLLYIDKWSRRKILVAGALAMAIVMLAIAVVSAIYDDEFQTDSPPGLQDGTFDASVGFDSVGSYVILALLCLFIACFALSWGPISWIYPAEIYPQMIRANAMGVTSSCSYLFNLFISLVSPVMFRDITWGTYLFFCCWCLIMALVVHLSFPETRGKSLEEIQLIFSGALIDQRPDAHHPATAAEALLHLEQIQHKNKRDQLDNSKRQGTAFAFDLPTNNNWSDAVANNNTIVVSSPHNVSRALSHRDNSHDGTTSTPTSRDRNNSSTHHWTVTTENSLPSSSSSIELTSLNPPLSINSTKRRSTAAVQQQHSSNNGFRNN